MAQNEHLRESNELAELIQRRLGRVHPGPSRGVKQAGFRVLVTAFMPAVLVEIGFGTNAAEASYMSDPSQHGRAIGSDLGRGAGVSQALRAPRRNGAHRERSGA